MSDLVLVLNCGSSSIKFGLFDARQEPLPREPLWHGKIEGITGPRPTVSVSSGPADTAHAQTSAADPRTEPVSLDAQTPYLSALAHIRERVRAQLGGRRLLAVAHRIVHGGSKYFAPVRVDPTVLADLRSYVPLAPLHQPFALEAVERLLEERPDLPQVACFDTAFHSTMPRLEQLLPLPKGTWERGLRCYGFHGLSYEYMSIVLAERYGERARGRSIVAHLGSGASLCGMRELRSVTSSMGFSALDGLMMGTRCGALDPGAVLYLMEVEKLSLAEVGHILYHQSGLLGVSGISSDPRVLLSQEGSQPAAREALTLYVNRIVREIGAVTATLGGLEMLVFTAGIGEHNAAIRERICQGLAYLGLQMDTTANAQHAGIVSTADSKVLVAIEATNEEWVAARHARRLLGYT